MVHISTQRFFLILNLWWFLVFTFDGCMEQDMSRESAHYTMCLIICYLLPLSGRIGLTEVHFTLICEGACGPKYISAKFATENGN